MWKWVLACWLSAVCSFVFAQDRADYIEQYKDIAVSEMMRTGIPASIKLAQAMHESACGKSDLACKANNHFGIKCGNDWNGKTYKKEDDDYKDGELVKSCFREFRSVYDSYIAHSDFLADPAKSKRYGSLFELEPTDYKGWAKGLSKAGYATDPHYANKLIDIIERYELYRYDDSSGAPIASKHAPKPSLAHDLIRYHNDVKYSVAMAGDTPSSFAKRNDMTARQIIKYNDGIDNENQVLQEGTRIYLQPKFSQNHGKQKTHQLKPGESLTEISQLYAIKLDALLKRNGLQKGDIPAPNQKIVLKGKSKHKLRTVSPYDIPGERPAEMPSTHTSEQNEIVSTEKTIEVKPVVRKDTTTSTAVKKDTTPAPVMKAASPAISMQPAKTEVKHTVVKGDTLYGISRQYNLPVDELKKLNNLSADTISIGQKLTVK